MIRSRVTNHFGGSVVMSLSLDAFPCLAAVELFVFRTPHSAFRTPHSALRHQGRRGVVTR
jgi:hypothetical protein